MVCIAFAGSAHAERRVALVIGNANYNHIAHLPNVSHDAAAMAGLFKSAKFDSVETRHNLGVAELRRALREFASRVADADMAVLFYAGHGIEVGQVNYLIPVDARLATDFDVEDETVPLDRVLQAMEPARRLRLVLLDACRDNPFVKSMKRAIATRSVGRGLGRVEPSTTNTLIAYATKPNAVAEDGKGPNSPFTAALVKHLLTPGLDLRIVLGQVRDEVLVSTARKQEPYVVGSLGGGTVSITGDASKPGPSPASIPLGAADHMWAVVKDTTSIPALEAFRQRYGKEDPVYDRLAEARIEHLKRQQLAALKAERERKRTQDYKRPAEADLSRPGRFFYDCPECPEMVVLPAGEFTMGTAGESKQSWAGAYKMESAGEFKTESDDVQNTERPTRKVTISGPFAVGRFEVTFAEWDACVAAGGCKHWPGDEGWGRDRRPVINVSWHDAKEYTTWLSIKTGRSYRLLSEAEWEYAARAGTTTLYAFGDTITKNQAHFLASQPTVVGSFPPNRFGLHDLHGNVFEWTEDHWQSNYQAAPIDGSAWRSGGTNERVVRGGSWLNENPGLLRSATRLKAPAHGRGNFVGFRVARKL
jgi:formylglycine-generating enzyme required for sulfatase activity